MSKARVIGAGATIGRANRGGGFNTAGNQGGGNKLQGLVGTTNMPVELVPYVRTQADGGNSRNWVFCMNQLGGVGRRWGQAAGPGNRGGVHAVCRRGAAQSRLEYPLQTKQSTGYGSPYTFRANPFRAPVESTPPNGAFISMFGPPFFDWTTMLPNVGEIMNAVKTQQQQPGGSGFAKDLLILFAGGSLTGGPPSTRQQQDALQGASGTTASPAYSVSELLLPSGVTKDVYMNIGGGDSHDRRVSNGWNQNDFILFDLADILSKIKAMGYTGICFDLESSDLDPTPPPQPPNPPTCTSGSCSTSDCKPDTKQPPASGSHPPLGEQLIGAFKAVKKQGMKVMLTTQYFFGDQLKYGRLIPGLLAETTDDGQPLIDILAPQLYACSLPAPWCSLSLPALTDADWSNKNAICERSNYVSAFPPDSGTGTALMPVVNCATTYEELTAAFKATLITPHPPSPEGMIYYLFGEKCPEGTACGDETDCLCPCAS